MPSSHLILCRPLLLLPPIPPSIRVFSNESSLHMRWPKYWNFSFSIIPSKEIPGLISFRMDWWDLLAVQVQAAATGALSAAERSYPASEVRGSAREEPPHVQGAVAGRVQEGLEEPSHVAALTSPLSLPMICPRIEHVLFKALSKLNCHRIKCDIRTKSTLQLQRSRSMKGTNFVSNSVHQYYSTQSYIQNNSHVAHVTKLCI